MFHSRKLNHRINTLHERALRIVYRDNVSSFDTLLEKNKSFRIHDRNIQTLAIELYKVCHGISPEIMNLVFPVHVNPRRIEGKDFMSRNVKSVNYGTDTSSHVGPKIWKLVHIEWKNLSLCKFI